MSHKVAVDKVNLIIGKSTFYTVKNGEVSTLQENLPDNVVFILNSIKVTEDDKEIVLGKEQNGKRFVPSFELGNSGKEFIINYFAEATEDQPAIKLRGVVNTETMDISITGEGFEYAEVEVCEYTPTEIPVSEAPSYTANEEDK